MKSLDVTGQRWEASRVNPKLPQFRKVVFTATLLLSLGGAVPGLADHITLNITTATQSGWTINTSGITNAIPFLYVEGGSPADVGLSVSSRGDGSGIYLNGSTNFASFDGYWTATYRFYLPPAATNVAITFTNLGFDDAGVLFLNSNAIGAADTYLSSTGTNDGQIVLADGSASQPWVFTGPDYGVSGSATTGFILGGTNTLTAIVNNTGYGANGVLRTGLPRGDQADIALSATVSFDISPGAASLGIAPYPGLEISGTIGAEYQIQYSTNLTDGSWTTLTNLVLPRSPFLFFDSTAILGHAGRFYRAVGQ